MHTRETVALLDNINLRGGAILAHHFREDDLVVEHVAVMPVDISGFVPVKLGKIVLGIVVGEVVHPDLVNHVAAADRIADAFEYGLMKVVRREQNPYHPQYRKLQLFQQGIQKLHRAYPFPYIL